MQSASLICDIIAMLICADVNDFFPEVDLCLVAYIKLSMIHLSRFKQMYELLYVLREVLFMIMYQMYF